MYFGVLSDNFCPRNGAAFQWVFEAEEDDDLPVSYMQTYGDEFQHQNRYIYCILNSLNATNECRSVTFEN